MTAEIAYERLREVDVTLANLASEFPEARDVLGAMCALVAVANNLIADKALVAEPAGMTVGQLALREVRKARAGGGTL